MNGLILLDKPAGITSFAATDAIRRLLKVKKAGHTGTLDPFATGLLIVCIGQATRLVPYLQAGAKEYVATLQLGQERDTQDLTGQVTAEFPIPTLSREKIEDVLRSFTGQIEQIPPMYSAIKVDGQRLYALAREGVTIDRKPRLVHIKAIALIDWQPDSLTICVTCSGGTYIRALAYDIGRQLGCGAYLSVLRRTKNGGHSIEQAVTLENLAQLASPPLLSLAQMTAAWPEFTLSEADLKRIEHGNRIEISHALASPIRLLNPTGAVVAIAECLQNEKRSWLQPKIVFSGI